jgi:hypothetical protein
MFLKDQKKGKGIVVLVLSFYGCFLVTSIASTTPMMTITMIIATIPYMSVLFEAKPESGVAVGADVAGAFCIIMPVSSFDPQ